MAVTLFQSALLKLTVDQPFYDHLVHNLLLSYKRLIEKLIKTHDIATAREFVRAALRLEIRGRMAQDATFLRKFSGVFQDLGIVLLRNRLNQESVLCCRKVISVYPSPGSYVNLTNSLSAAGQRALTWTGLSSIMQLGRGQSGPCTDHNSLEPSVAPAD